MLKIKKTDIDTEKPLVRKDYKNIKVFTFNLVSGFNSIIEVEANNINEAKLKVKEILED